MYLDILLKIIRLNYIFDPSSIIIVQFLIILLIFIKKLMNYSDINSDDVKCNT